MPDAVRDLSLRFELLLQRSFGALSGARDLGDLSSSKRLSYKCVQIIPVPCLHRCVPESNWKNLWLKVQVGLRAATAERLGPSRLISGVFRTKEAMCNERPAA